MFYLSIPSSTFCDGLTSAGKVCAALDPQTSGGVTTAEFRFLANSRPSGIHTTIFCRGISRVSTRSRMVRFHLDLLRFTMLHVEDACSTQARVVCANLNSFILSLLWCSILFYRQPERRFQVDARAWSAPNGPLCPCNTHA